MIASLSINARAARSSLYTSAMEHARTHELPLLYTSLVLLLASTFDRGTGGSLGTFGALFEVGWLATFLFLTLANTGAALAVYIAALAIYAPLHFEGQSSLLDRPDNLAVLILFGATALRIFSHREKVRWFTPLLGAILVFFALHGLLFAPENLASVVRDCLIPFAACGMAGLVGFRERDWRAMEHGLAALGAYTGLVSILERTGQVGLALPPWIADPSLRPPDLFLDQWLGSGRAGGTLLQPAFSGLLMSMILLFVIARARRGLTLPRASVVLLCVIGIFLTYTRGVWLCSATGLFLFPGWCRTPRQTRNRRVAIVCLAVCFLLFAPSKASQRLQQGDTILYRFNLWGAGVRLIAQHPLTGVGFFKFGTAMTSVQQGLGPVQPEYREVEEGVASHNTLLTVMVEFGLLGFALYTATFYQVVNCAIARSRSFLGSPGRSWVVALACVYLVSAQFISSFEGTVNTAFFGLLGALAGSRDPMV